LRPFGIKNPKQPCPQLRNNFFDPFHFNTSISLCLDTVFLITEKERADFELLQVKRRVSPTPFKWMDPFYLEVAPLVVVDK